MSFYQKKTRYNYIVINVSYNNKNVYLLLYYYIITRISEYRNTRISESRYINQDMKF